MTLRGYLLAEISFCSEEENKCSQPANHQKQHYVKDYTDPRYADEISLKVVNLYFRELNGFLSCSVWRYFFKNSCWSPLIVLSA